MSPLARAPLFAAGAASLLAGILAGEVRLGWPGPDLALAHGPLMVCGFFGTVIGLERAVALSHPWGYAAPAATGLGGLLLILGHGAAAAAAITLGSLLFAAMALLVLRRQPQAFTAVMALGALSWLGANLAWLAGAEVARLVPAWAAFLVFTIAGERLELSRFLAPWKWRTPTLVPAVLLVAAGIGTASWPLFGLGLLALVAWSLMNDVARRTVRQPGLTRYVALCLLSGYGWLAVAGVAAIAGPGEAGYGYDAALHALFVGFVFCMVFGHAPIIAPAVLKVSLPYRPYFYGPLLLLHLSLILRLLGDAMEIDGLRQWGGLLNGVAIVTFVLTMAGTAVAARRR
jgi:hypothetical protein